MKSNIMQKSFVSRKPSRQRRNLAIATWEGVPSTIFQTLLGGQFLTGFLLYLGANSAQIGFVLAITTFVNIAQIAVAFLIQRLTSRKWALVLFVGLHRILWGATGLVPFVLPRHYWVAGFIALYIAAFIFNTVGAMLWNSLISDIVPTRVRGRYFGIRNTFLNALNTLVMFLGGMVLDHYPAAQGFFYLYIVIWICAIANIIVFMFYPDAAFERSAESKFMPMLRKPLQDGAFMKATLFLAGFLLLQNLVVPLYSYVMLELLHINYQTISLLNVTQTVFMMGSFYVWGNLNARYSNRRLLFWTLPIIALAILCWGGLSVLPVLPVLFLAHMIFGVGVGGFNQLAFNFMIGDTPKSERPMYMAMYSAITGVASFFGPLLGGQVLEWIESWPMWTQIFGMQLFVGASMIVLAASLGRKILRDA
ncbi:transporter, major facilitator family protein [Paenibacillus sp. oral taxon 786 str. D14]|uniref:MFS transporter n=1 Tax=Paenibacillus sp. oral taxon 786 TaxID=652715 RepID=UPI0001AFCC15|nr:MFS transporter [Paenibacillus sp. oral taxon 786]EES74987.1 transporter, major facilitator family protein [Paenibacillus sp. oral taxon 786 str. D14]